MNFENFINARMNETGDKENSSVRNVFDIFNMRKVVPINIDEFIVCCYFPSWL
jgi:hypothetical protein